MVGLAELIPIYVAIPDIPSRWDSVQESRSHARPGPRLALRFFGLPPRLHLGGSLGTNARSFAERRWAFESRRHSMASLAVAA